MKQASGYVVAVSAILLATLSEVALAQEVSIDVTVSEEATGVVVYSGAANVCDETGQNCVIAEAGCGAVVADSQRIVPVDEAEKVDFIEETFPFAVDQQPLQADFQVETGDCFIVLDPIQPGVIQPIPASGN